MRKILLFLLFASINIVHGQLVIGNNSQTPAQFVQNSLLGNGISVSNIKFNGTTAAANAIMDQVGKFSNGNTTNIGITNGIILATGNASVAIGPNNQSGASMAPAVVSLGDPDLAMLTTGVVKNTSIIEFDFVPIGQNLSFNFVFASEEYLEFVNSNYNDVFGFFISGPGISGPYSGNAKNIAILPNTTTAITINNINNLVNSSYYINNGTGSTPLVNTTIQYDGFTKVIAALSNVQCGETYHIKLAVANVGDNSYDSAVLLEANSFNANQSINLPTDLLVSNGLAPCNGTTQQICTGLSNSILHEWSLNGNIISGVSGSCVNISSPGQLCVTVYPMGNACPTTQCINVEFAPPMPISTPNNLVACLNSTYNLTSNNGVILNGLNASSYTISYYHNQLDAQNSTNPITNITNYPGVSNEIIWARIVNNSSGCKETKSFNLILDLVNTTITPTFNPIGPYYQNAVPDILPTFSTNSISGTWSPSTISTTTLGTQTYTYTPNAGQCASITSFDIIVNSLNSQQFSSNNLIVYPNPTKEQLTIQMSANIFVKQIKLSDMLGRVIKIENFTSSNSLEVINLKEFAKGSYFIEVISDNNLKEIKKIIIN